jgi:prepilin-type N-terminal cleavage/methylation domain-containing protein
MTLLFGSLYSHFGRPSIAPEKLSLDDPVRVATVVKIEQLEPGGLDWPCAGVRADRTARVRTAGASCRGFSLLEALLVVALVGIAAVFAVPSFRVFGRRARINGIAREINVQLIAARHQAIKRGDFVGIKISAGTGPATCQEFVDLNHNGSYDSGSDLLLASFRPGTQRAGTFVKIDNLDVSSPSSTLTEYTIVFTQFGSLNPPAALKSVYIGDSFGNLVQISTPNTASGRVEMTKWNGSGSVGTFNPPPWTWN